ncbi:MAG: UDP-N-acetylglucosamine--N-acetylmuramyl-(pentapeptide) pyrophosphoryl-undecaprenol N-acetylglucosamine transferase, partial [Elusimicrobia bacterium]|nr:UDP-N-acetylglucosamine--N-acetylmuramyl-(pentapeptide) pyrophosphoryl-undecaprenol N-acetylglucosamine transferase [Elusimicrobiota bacterium]MBD3412213.1 UDP-N-acetylglucosamine--N-acetylmuramyl-(pentapeptide) pyrophosphoryl-undecaprenol N-acetylglucosamine transferase [Elusimicrobiota bacterium]
MNQKLIFIAAGGTGGHVMPGIALARELKARGHTVRFIVKNNDRFITVIRNYSFEIREIDIAGWNRRSYLQ